MPYYIYIVVEIHEDLATKFLQTSNRETEQIQRQVYNNEQF